MIILMAVLAGSLLLYRALGALGVEPLATWPAATRWALATLLLLTASAHFNRMKEELVRMVPAWMPAPRGRPSRAASSPGTTAAWTASRPPHAP